MHAGKRCSEVGEKGKNRAKTCGKNVIILTASGDRDHAIVDIVFLP